MSAWTICAARATGSYRTQSCSASHRCRAFIGLCKVKRGERAVDLCTGNGVIPILLEAKNNGEHYSGLELQPQCADLARRSVRYNHLEDKVTIEEGECAMPQSFSVGSPWRW